MSDVLAFLLLAPLAAFFAAISYGSLKARITGRPHLFAVRVGKRRPGFLIGLVFAWMAFLFAVGAIVSIGHLAGYVNYDAADE